MLAAISGNNTFLALAIIHTRQSETEFLVMIDGNVPLIAEDKGWAAISCAGWKDGRERNLIRSIREHLWLSARAAQTI
ncbi:MAG: hypothetical protein MUO40_07530 [Anaerolineaceae bacterium]|nr:hypothetical protein [Anaerolineaceae bacterium]